MYDRMPQLFGFTLETRIVLQRHAKTTFLQHLLCRWGNSSPPPPRCTALPSIFTLQDKPGYTATPSYYLYLESIQFCEHIRNYNNALSFSSLGAHIDHSVAGQRGCYTFRIRGELVHRIGSLTPWPGTAPKFAQLYIYDSDPVQQAERRMQYHHGHVHRDVLLRLQDLLRQYRNPYYDVYFTAMERVHNQQPVSLRLRTIVDNRVDQRRYNRPTAPEVALILPGSGEDQFDNRDLVVHERGGYLKSVSELRSDYLPLRYPLLFPRGEQGWHRNMRADVTSEVYVPPYRVSY
jgi:hypothetical protein